MSDSKALDAQAGFESGTGLFLAALAGINSVSGPGMHYFESCQSPEKTVFDAELCRMARRLAAGIEVRDDFPAGPLFDQLIREQNLLTAEHTLKYFRLEHCVPGPVIDRTQVDAAAASPPVAVDPLKMESSPEDPQAIAIRDSDATSELWRSLVVTGHLLSNHQQAQSQNGEEYSTCVGMRRRLPTKSNQPYRHSV